LGLSKKTSKSIKIYSSKMSVAKKIGQKAMPFSGSILFNKSTLSSQKEVYIHHFEVMEKAVQKWGSKIS